MLKDINVNMNKQILHIQACNKLLTNPENKD